MASPTAGSGGRVSGLHVIGGIVAMALLVYLCVALLKPEMFE